jgi:hypothetical protein
MKPVFMRPYGILAVGLTCLLLAGTACSTADSLSGEWKLDYSSIPSWAAPPQHPEVVLKLNRDYTFDYKELGHGRWTHDSEGPLLMPDKRTLGSDVLGLSHAGSPEVKPLRMFFNKQNGAIEFHGRNFVMTYRRS